MEYPGRYSALIGNKEFSCECLVDLDKMRITDWDFQMDEETGTDIPGGDLSDEMVSVNGDRYTACWEEVEDYGGELPEDVFGNGIIWYGTSS